MENNKEFKKDNEELNELVDTLTSSEMSGFMKLADHLLSKMSKKDNEAKMLLLDKKISDKMTNILDIIHYTKDQEIKENRLKEYNNLLEDILNKLNEHYNKLKSEEKND